MRPSRSIATGVLVASLSGCATDVAKHSEPATLTAPTSMAAAPARLELTSDVRLSLRSGFRIGDLKRGTMLAAAGTIPQGTVYRTDRVLMARTGNAHEAFLVVRADEIVGVYLPVEAVFVAARPACPFDAKESTR